MMLKKKQQKGSTEGYTQGPLPTEGNSSMMNSQKSKQVESMKSSQKQERRETLVEDFVVLKKLGSGAYSSVYSVTRK